MNKNESREFYYENDKKVFTEVYHLKRGSCCGSGCRHCPFWPKYQKGNIKVRESFIIQKK